MWPYIASRQVVRSTILEATTTNEKTAEERRSIFDATTSTEVQQMEKSQGFANIGIESLKIKPNTSSREAAKNAKKQRSGLWKTYEKCGKTCGKTSKNCGKLERDEQAEATADSLVGIFGAEYCRKYFIKCAYYLSPDEISQALTASSSPKVLSPIKYFNHVTKRMLARRGL